MTYKNILNHPISRFAGLPVRSYWFSWVLGTFKLVRLGVSLNNNH